MRGQWCHGHGGRRDAHAGQHVDLVVDDQLLREAARLVGQAGVVLDDQLDLLACYRVAMLRHIQACSGFDLAAGGGLLARHGQHQADLEFLLGHHTGRAGGQGSQGQGLQKEAFFHQSLRVVDG